MSPGRRPEPFSPKHWFWSSPTESSNYHRCAKLFACAVLARITLPDAFSWTWWPSLILYGTGAVLVFLRGSAGGFLLCALGSLLGLLFFQDQLTQSVFLLAYSLAQLIHFVGPQEDRSSRLEEGFLASVRWLTASVYWAAGLHKLNRDFFDPEVSCAQAGADFLAQHVGLASAPQTAFFRWSLFGPGTGAPHLAFLAATIWPPGRAQHASAPHHRFRTGLRVRHARGLGIIHRQQTKQTAQKCSEKALGRG